MYSPGLSPFARALAAEIASSDAGLQSLPPDLEAYVARRDHDLASFTKLAVSVLGWSMAAVVFVAERCRFESLGSNRRRVWISRWDRSMLGPVRQFVRFYRSLVLLWAYEDRYADDLRDHR